MKVWQPLTAFDVVYFVTPTKNSVDRIIDDFAVSRKYRFVHLFFTDSKYIMVFNYPLHF